MQEVNYSIESMEELLFPFGLSESEEEIDIDSARAQK